MSVLVVSPHADDEVLGCGGTIARRADEGHEVHVAVAAVGAVRRSDGSPKVDADTRLAELAASCARLGVASHEVLFDDLENRLDTLPTLDLVSRLDALFESRPWEELLLPCSSFHQDHRVLHEASLAALRQRPGRARERRSALYEYPCATWSASALQGGAWYVSIGRWMDRKLAALEAYASQRVPDPEPTSPEGVRRLAALRGSEVGVDAAERFHVLYMLER